MTTRPDALVLDVNETLTDMRPLADRFADAGAPRELAPLWFASTLRDAFALAASGGARPFRDVGAATLRSLLHGRPVETDAAVEAVLDGMTQLKLHPDVEPGLRRLHEGGIRLVPLTNGGAAGAERLLAPVRDLLEAVLSVDDAGVWKPAPKSYAYASTVTGLPAGRMMMVAVHPWDLHGAQAAGLRAAWVDRQAGSPWPGCFTAPELTVGSFVELAEALGC